MYTEIQRFHFMGRAPGKLTNSENDFACLFWPSWGKYSSVQEVFPACENWLPFCWKCQWNPWHTSEKSNYYGNLSLLFQSAVFQFLLLFVYILSHYVLHFTFCFFNPRLLPFYIVIIFYKTKPKKLNHCQLIWVIFWSCYVLC